MEEMENSAPMVIELLKTCVDSNTGSQQNKIICSEVFSSEQLLCIHNELWLQLKNTHSNICVLRFSVNYNWNLLLRNFQLIQSVLMIYYIRLKGLVRQESSPSALMYELQTYISFVSAENFNEQVSCKIFKCLGSWFSLGILPGNHVARCKLLDTPFKVMVRIRFQRPSC